MTDLEPLRQYAASRRQFLDLIGSTGSCREPLAEFSEWIVADVLGATPAASRVQKGFDVEVFTPSRSNSP
jgi:hypothetical protein